MSKLPLTKFEAEILNWLLAGEEPVLDALRMQLTRATVLSKVFTGHGIYINFYLPSDVIPLYKELTVKPRFCFGDVEASIPSLEYGAHFILWVEDGRLAFLEGVTYDESYPQEISDFQLRYLSEEGRDWDYLREQWKITNEEDT
jgi:hypothetical protein